MKRWKQCLLWGAALAVIGQAAIGQAGSTKEEERASGAVSFPASSLDLYIAKRKEKEAEEAEKEEKQAEWPPPEETELLHRLYHYMEWGEPESAAKLLNKNADALKRMLAETFLGERYLFTEVQKEDGSWETRIEKLTEETTEKGLVLSKYNTLFFGDFCRGKPEGNCAAIQAIVLDEPRYTYAAGNWKNGKMDGPGTTGYLYYEDAPENGFVMTKKQGNYTDDFLDGDVVYQAVNADGETQRWKFRAEMGVTVLDERWVRHESTDEYTLAASDKPDRTYVLDAKRAKSAIWYNLISWE